MTLERAQLSARFVLERLRDNVEDAQQQQYPVGSGGPLKWLQLIEGLRRTAESYLRESTNPSHAQDKRLKLVDEASALAVVAYELLVEIRGADSSELPVPTVKPLQRWINELGLPNTAVFRAELAANYEIYRFHRRDFQRFRDPAKELTDAITATTWPVLRITVPAKAFAIVPHLAVVAHEIGHALYDRVTPDRKPLTAELTLAEKRVEARLGKFDSEARSEFVSILSSWVEELTADAVMFHLTGPAGFFALADVLQFLSGPDGFSKSHPASSERRRILFSRLCRPFEGTTSHADVFKNHTGCVLTEDINSPLIETPADSDYIFRNAQQLRNHTVTQAAIIAELHTVMRHAESLVYDTVHRYLSANAKSLLYTPTQLGNDLRDHFHAMLAAIPPVETGDALNKRVPAAFASILNVGWAVLLTKLPELRVRTPEKSDPMVSKMERLHGLLLKAVELSEARRTWTAA